MSPELLERLLERKFILSLVAQLAALALVALGKIDGAQRTNINMVVIGTFTLGNLAENLAKQ